MPNHIKSKHRLTEKGGKKWTTHPSITLNLENKITSSTFLTNSFANCTWLQNTSNFAVIGHASYARDVWMLTEHSIRYFCQNDLLLTTFSPFWKGEIRLWLEFMVFRCAMAGVKCLKWGAATNSQRGLRWKFCKLKNLTDAGRRARLPVVSVFHLNAGDPRLAL